MFDRYASIVFMALGVALFFYAQTLTTSSTGGSIGPKELPLFLAVVLILFSLVNLVTALRAKAAPKQDGPAYRQFLVILGLLLAYVFLWNRWATSFPPSCSCWRDSRPWRKGSTGSRP